jgi:hypothetical protein
MDGRTTGGGRVATIAWTLEVGGQWRHCWRVETRVGGGGYLEMECRSGG